MRSVINKAIISTVKSTFIRVIGMLIISANDLKTRGVTALSDSEETFITVRGETRYVVLGIAAYEELRQAELEIALAAAKRDIKNGDYVIETVDDHIKRITK